MRLLLKNWYKTYLINTTIMKTLITTVLFVCFGVLASFAQTQQGNVMWGASVSNIGLDLQKGNTGFI